MDKARQTLAAARVWALCVPLHVTTYLLRPLNIGSVKCGEECFIRIKNASLITTNAEGRVKCLFDLQWVTEIFSLLDTTLGSRVKELVSDRKLNYQWPSVKADRAVILYLPSLSEEVLAQLSPSAIHESQRESKPRATVTLSLHVVQYINNGYGLKWMFADFHRTDTVPVLDRVGLDEVEFFATEKNLKRSYLE